MYKHVIVYGTSKKKGNVDSEFVKKTPPGTPEEPVCSPKPNEVFSSEYFETLWSLILKEIHCDTFFQPAEFYRPFRRVDALWAHSFLASHCYWNYIEPLEFSWEPHKCESKSKYCYRHTKERTLILRDRPDAEFISLEEQNLCPKFKKVEALRIQTAFANRNFPWYILKPEYLKGHEIDVETRHSFSKGIQRTIMRALDAFQIKIMIVYIGPEAEFDNVTEWLRYCRWTQVIIITHCMDIERKLHLTGGIFHPVYLVENETNRWQDELTRSLEAGVRAACELRIYDNCSIPFIYIFPETREKNSPMTFQVLRRHWKADPSCLGLPIREGQIKKAEQKVC